MKLFIEDADGTLTELQQVKVIGEGDLIIRTTSVYYRNEDIEEKEKYLSAKLGRKVILLDGRYGEIMMLPPKK